MAHYAVLDDDNVVIEVLTGMDEDNTNLPDGFDDWESYYSSLRDNKTVKRTSYNTPQRLDKAVCSSQTKFHDSG